MAANTSTACRRKVRRHRLTAESRSRIDFTHPAPNGCDLALSLLDVSSAGFSFALEQHLPDLESGANVDCVVLHVGDCEIRGDIMIIHVNQERGVCGALFYPSTDTDLIKLRALMAGIESVAS
jgi:hypothetical protein